MRRRLDTEMVRRRLTESRTLAARLVSEGRVVVGGAPVLTPARLVGADEAINVESPPARYVSRGGIKLEAALEAFEVGVDGQDVLDVGASTGGFTDCLLQHGANRVVAVDVGRAQFHLRLASNPKVLSLERTDIRELDVEKVGGPFSLVVADVSFISLTKIAKSLSAAVLTNGDLMTLIKPQFEATKKDISRGGILKDEATQLDCVTRVIQSFGSLRFRCVDFTESPITGTDGNREFFALFSRVRGAVDPSSISKTVRSADE